MAAIPILALLLAAALQPVQAPASAPAVRAEPVNPLYASFNGDDYPTPAILGREEGRVAYRLEVAADGFVRTCSVTASSGSASLDSSTCRMLRARIRFVPARDRQGRFVADSYASSMTWSLPPLPAGPLDLMHLRLPTPSFGRVPPVIQPIRPLPLPAPAAGDHLPGRAVPLHTFPFYLRQADYPPAARRDRVQGQVYFTLTIGADGRVADCEIMATSGSPALDEATCRILRSRARYAPARDAAGVPVAGVDRSTFVWRLAPTR